ncbi:MAG: thioesterase family protein [Thermodesulfobacteriota bacterium]|nr:thioesterase family protein [Thermodesulfobacteriota bacterium]
MNTSKDALKPGMTFEFKYIVPEDKTVPHLFTDIVEAQAMPKVFATGFLVGLFEFACIKAINPYIDWPREQTVGISIQIDHTAATPPNFTVTVKGTLTHVEGRKLTFSLVADDGVEPISKGVHERFVIDADKFNAQIKKKDERHGKHHE